MRYIRYASGSNEYFGLLTDCNVRKIEGSVFSENHIITDTCFDISQIKLLPPVKPTKIIALGYNYKDLVGEKSTYQEPVIFLKPSSSIIGPGGIICIFKNMKTWSEVELAIIIGRECRNISIGDAHKYIFGYTIGNDITMENIHVRDHHLARSKAPDTFCPLGPFIETSVNSSKLKMTNSINGQIFQQSNTSNRIINDREIIYLVSQFMTLFPGDVILTGTPANAENSVIRDGDTVVLEIENLSQLVNKVKEL